MILGMSKDEPKTQKKFQEKFQLPFKLLSDPDLEVQKAWGVWGVRTTVIVGPDGKVVKVFSKVKVDGHVTAVLEAL